MTPACAASKRTVPLNAALPFIVTSAVVGETDTEIGRGGAIVIAEAADFVESATDVAVNITFRLAGMDDGGV